MSPTETNFPPSTPQQRLPNDPAPMYHTFGELFEKGFTIDWVSAPFLTITHLLAIIGAPLAFYYAPEGFSQLMVSWMIVHVLLGSVSTTVYSHRLITHQAARVVRWPVHVLFGVIGQTLAVQGSVRRWAAMHTLHHGVDRTGRHELDPYSATWFESGWRNFLWSHVLTYFFWHPQDKAADKAFAAKSNPILVWQDRYYVVLLVAFNFLLPLVLGALVSGSVWGGVCLMLIAIASFVLVQNNTWTVNSVTHLWGFTKGAISSAKNNYIWLGPLGEGNHHADHHDFGRDYRNGFGWSGWLLDPTRYIILLLNALGLVQGLQRATKKQEAEIIARRKLLEAQSSTQPTRWQKWESKLEKLKAEWVEATHHWEAFKQKKLQLQNMHLPQFELQQKLDQLKAEVEVSRRAMLARKQAFLDALYEMRAMQFAG